MTSSDEPNSAVNAAAHSAALTPDAWQALRAHTPARIGLGRVGSGLPTQALLAFGAAHAQARDAVHVPLDTQALAQTLQALPGLPPLHCVTSAAPNRASYLLRPDWGRRLSDLSRTGLASLAAPACDLLLVVADGLSAAAVQRQVPPLLAHVLAQRPAGWQLGPVVVATQARVALGDDIGQTLRAGMVAVLIGERPGLSSPDSLGIYLTHAPHVGCSDAQRNCISNIRPQGLGHALAARKLWWLAQEARRMQLTGVALKDRSDEEPLLTATTADAAATAVTTVTPVTASSCRA